MEFASLAEVASLAAIHKAVVMVKLQALQEQSNLESVEMSAAVMGGHKLTHDAYPITSPKKIASAPLKSKRQVWYEDSQTKTLGNMFSIPNLKHDQQTFMLKDILNILS